MSKPTATVIPNFPPPTVRLEMSFHDAAALKEAIRPRPYGSDTQDVYDALKEAGL